MDEVTRDQFNILRMALLVSGIMLFLAIPSGLWPYGYYVVLRWVVSGTGVYSAVLTYKIKKSAWATILGLLALLFNPIIPIYLAKNDWVFADLVAAICYLTAIVFIKFPSDKQTGN